MCFNLVQYLFSALNAINYITVTPGEGFIKVDKSNRKSNIASVVNPIVGSGWYVLMQDSGVLVFRNQQGQTIWKSAFTTPCI